MKEFWDAFVEGVIEAATDWRYTVIPLLAGIIIGWIFT